MLTPKMDRDPGSLQHRGAQRPTGRKPRKRGDGSWEYQPLEEAMVEEGFESIGRYITRRKNTVVQYIATRLILDLCEQYSQRPGSRVSWKWW